MIKTSLSSRGLIGFVPSSIGILLALLVFVAFPNSSALAVQCAEVTFEEEWGYNPEHVYVSMFTATVGATIFFVHNYYHPPGPYPGHNGSQPNYGTQISNPNYPFVVVEGMNGFFKAIAWKSGVCTDSNPTSYSVER